MLTSSHSGTLDTGLASGLGSDATRRGGCAFGAEALRISSAQHRGSAPVCAFPPSLNRAQECWPFLSGCPAGAGRGFRMPPGTSFPSLAARRHSNLLLWGPSAGETLRALV